MNMKEWNDIFGRKTKVNGKVITVGQQDFDDSSILVKEENGNIISCPMGIDGQGGDIHFLYDNILIYLKWI